jgi:imidazolonepropionase
VSISVDGAAQVLRPPSDGLPYLRHDRAAELVLDGGSVAIDGGRIAGWDPDPGAAVRIDASGCAVLPGLVDCHTHLPFAGWREREYEMKVTGVPYEQIARSGGGIRSSARALAEAGDAEVLVQAGGIAAEMLAAGTTTFECKSGYGLSKEGEVRALRLAGELGAQVDQTTRSTALLAHAVPDGHDADSWMDVVDQMAGDVASGTGASALDIYVESVAFTNDHLARMGQIARRTRLDLRAHVEQFNANRSVPVAIGAGARSVDHLACLHPDDIAPLAAAECAAVLLPGAEFLGDERVAPARELADAGAICVLATDCNPGTSPIASLPVIVGLAVRRYGWSAREALLAVTLNAAWVLRLSADTGSLEVGKRGDAIVVDGPVERIPYRFGRNPVACAIVGGELAYVRPDFERRVRR